MSLKADELVKFVTVYDGTNADAVRKSFLDYAAGRNWVNLFLLNSGRKTQASERQELQEALETPPAESGEAAGPEKTVVKEQKKTESEELQTQEGTRSKITNVKLHHGIRDEGFTSPVELAVGPVTNGVTVLPSFTLSSGCC